MAAVYRPRHPERIVLYQVLFHYFDRFLAEYEGRFEKEYGFFRPVVKEVVERYLDCGHPHCGFARIRCPGCGEEGSAGFPIPLALSAGPGLVLHHLELNMTSDGPPIYPPQRWSEAKSMLERLSDLRSRKGPPYSYDPINYGLICEESNDAHRGQSIGSTS